MTSQRIVRFEVPSQQVLEQLAHHEFGFDAQPAPAAGEFSREVHFDTPAGDLERRGISARLTILSNGRSTFAVNVLNGEVAAAERVSSEFITETDISAEDVLFALDVEPVRLLRSIIDPRHLQSRVELETTCRRRILEANDSHGSSLELCLFAVTVRRDEAAIDFFEVEIAGDPEAAEAVDELAGELRDKYGLMPTYPSRVARARALLEEVEVDRLAQELAHSRRVAVVVVRDGAVALIRAGEELRVPQGEGWGEAACRRVLRQSFGSSRGRVRFLGTNPGFGWGPALEVWLVEGAGEAGDDPATLEMFWLPLHEISARAASPELRHAETLAALHTLLRNVPITRGATPDRISRTAASRTTHQSAPVQVTEAVEAVEGFQRRRTRELERPPPEALLNMELSELAFQERVLALAADPEVPLLERFNFLSIVGSNLDQFFRTRVAGFHKQLASGSRKLTLDGLTASEQLEVIGIRTRRLIADAYDLLWNDLLPALRGEGIDLVDWSQLLPSEQAYLEENYAAQLGAVLNPLTADPGHSFPHVRNLRPALAVNLRSPVDEDAHLAVIELPGDLPRFLPLPGGRRFVPIEEVVRAALTDLFHGAEVLEAHLFRVTRSANISVDEEAPDRLEAVQEKLLRRTLASIVRLEVEAAMPEWMRERLLRDLQFSSREAVSVLSEADVYAVDRLVDLFALEEIAELPIEELHYPPFERSIALDRERTVWEQIAEGDKLLRFPRDSFESGVERLLAAAAADEDVVSIRITLYRTSRASHVVDLLRKARRRGKEVVALIELTASFDEQRNIEWARMLESTGIHVVFGPPRLKVHAKVLLIVRHEADQPRRYTYVGTGNLNAATAAAYTDLGLLTADAGVGEELQEVFNGLTGNATPEGFEHLLVAPVNMRERFLEMIERETALALAGRNGRIRIKINGLTDPAVIAALYRASQAGVRCDLVVRGICCLRPGVPGLSENIHVRSILGRFLEHSRIFEFWNDGAPEYFIGSADWRPRNLSRRVEVVTPIVDPEHRRTLSQILDEDLSNPSAWELMPDGSYSRVEPRE